MLGHTDLRRVFDQQPGDGPLMAACIYHPDDTASMAIYEDHVFCFGCNTYRWPDQFLPELAHRPLETRRSTFRKTQPGVKYIPNSMVETYHKWLMERFRARLEWLHARGLREDTIIANNIGHCGNAFTIPIPGGVGWCAIRYRRDDELFHLDGCPKYWGTSGANSAQLYWPVKPENRAMGTAKVFLCEGELDALRLAQEGMTAASMTNGCNAFKETHAEDSLLKTAERIYVCYDQDAPGRVAAGKVAQIIGDRARVVTWPEALGKDVTEFLQRWPLAALQRYITGADQ